jgi:hypothetical protein
MRGDIGQVPPACAHLMIDLELDSEPISGALQRRGGDPTHFSGWIELVSLLQDAATSPGVGASSHSAPAPAGRDTPVTRTGRKLAQ